MHATQRFSKLNNYVILLLFLGVPHGDFATILFIVYPASDIACWVRMSDDYTSCNTYWCVFKSVELAALFMSVNNTKGL